MKNFCFTSSCGGKVLDAPDAGRKFPARNGADSGAEQPRTVRKKNNRRIADFDVKTTALGFICLFLPANPFMAG
jgi:hypothetical protein